jgi:hypothetical protein
VIRVARGAGPRQLAQALLRSREVARFNRTKQRVGGAAKISRVSAPSLERPFHRPLRKKKVATLGQHRRI